MRLCTFYDADGRLVEHRFLTRALFEDVVKLKLEVYHTLVPVKNEGFSLYCLVF